MASASYAANKCSNCSRKVSDGIVRNSKFYCNTSCYDAVKQNRFSEGIRPSSIVVAPLPPVVIKKCSYCFETFEKHACPGVYHDRLWFCSNHHLQLANPRPSMKQVIVGPMMGPAIMGPPMGHLRIIGGPGGPLGPVMGPFSQFGPIGGPLGPVMGPFVQKYFW
jgi:hypothetical protein